MTILFLNELSEVHFCKENVKNFLQLCSIKPPEMALFYVCKVLVDLFRFHGQHLMRLKRFRIVSKNDLHIGIINDVFLSEAALHCLNQIFSQSKGSKLLFLLNALNIQS